MNNKPLPILTEELKMEIILSKFHMHTKEQWEELVKEYPYNEIPHLIEMVWKLAQGKKLNK